MSDLGHDLWFGYFLTPDAQQADAVLGLARMADQLGLDVLGMQDHPYQPRFLDTWTLLATIAGQTERIRLVPDVINLPLRPPAVLAKAAASLDILSGGRVELGIGAGAFGEAATAMGAPRRTVGESIEALAEAIHVIRALWTPGHSASFAGTHYQLKGAKPGPIPPHSIGIWVGSYKPRMLRLTGELADGWIPSSMYAPPDELPTMVRTIDEAARAAGRDPAAVRRAYNVAGRFTSAEGGFLQGPPRLWAEQLAELVMEQGFSVFVLASKGDRLDDMQRFAEEVAPAVREIVAQARASNRPSAPALQPAAVATVASATPQRSGATPSSTALNEAARPHAEQNNTASVTAAGRQSQQTLIAVHERLRQELAEIREAAAAVAAGRMAPTEARSVIYQTTMRQNYWTLGSFCAQYCRLVSIHHTIEDQHMFTRLEQADRSLTPVLDQLHHEHQVIAEMIEQLDRALTRMMSDPTQIVGVQRMADDFGNALLSHLAYEEDELLGPLGTWGIAL